jgi:hypothetical protein
MATRAFKNGAMGGIRKHSLTVRICGLQKDENREEEQIWENLRDETLHNIFKTFYNTRKALPKLHVA